MTVSSPFRRLLVQVMVEPAISGQRILPYCESKVSVSEGYRVECHRVALCLTYIRIRHHYIEIEVRLMLLDPIPRFSLSLCLRRSVDVIRQFSSRS